MTAQIGLMTGPPATGARVTIHTRHETLFIRRGHVTRARRNRNYLSIAHLRSTAAAFQQCRITVVALHGCDSVPAVVRAGRCASPPVASHEPATRYTSRTPLQHQMPVSTGTVFRLLYVVPSHVSSDARRPDNNNATTSPAHDHEDEEVNTKKALRRLSYRTLGIRRGMARASLGRIWRHRNQTPTVNINRRYCRQGRIVSQPEAPFRVCDLTACLRSFCVLPLALRRFVRCACAFPTSSAGTTSLPRSGCTGCSRLVCLLGLVRA